MSLLAYLAVASLLLWIVARCWQRVGRMAALVLLACPLVLTGPALVRDRVLGPIDHAYASEPLSAHKDLLGYGPRSPGILNDVHSQMIPWRAAVRAAWANGEWPLWNPFLLNGDLLLATSQPAPFAPLSLAELLLPIDLSLGFGVAITLFFASLGGFLFFREQRLSVPASLLGAIAWSWSGFELFWLHWPMGRCASFYPWVLLATWRVVKRPGARPAVALGALLAMLLLSGHPETVVHVVALAAVFAVIALWPEFRKRWRSVLRPIGWALAGGGVALLLAAPFLLPFVEALPHSAELGMRDATPRVLPVADAGPRALSQIVPFVFGTMGVEHGTAPDDWLFPPTTYVGSAVLALALLGTFAGRMRHRAFAIGSLVVCFAAAIAMAPIATFIEKLPLFSISINERLAFGGAFALAWLVAAGFDAAFARRAAESNHRLRVAGGVAAVAALGLLAAVAALGRPFGELFAVDAEFLASATWQILAFALVPLIVLVARPRRILAFALLAVALLAQRTAEMGHFYPSFPREAFYPRVAPLNAITDVVGRERVVGAGWAWIPNGSALYGLEDPRAYQAMTFGRLVETYPLWNKPLPVWFTQVNDLDRPFLDFMNIRYAVAASGVPDGVGWRRVAEGSDAKLLENPEAAPRFFVPRTVLVGSDRNRLLSQMRDETHFVRRVRIEPLEPDADVLAEPTAVRNPVATVEIRPRGSGYELAIDLPRESWVASSVTAWPGWRVESGGRALPLAYANHAFLGFLAPAGESVVTVRYRPRSFDLGLTLAAIGMLACFALQRRRAPRRA